MDFETNDIIKKKSCDNCKCPRGKLFATNWLEGISYGDDFHIAEVVLKNTRTGFYTNPNRLDLKIGDTVAVEGAPGHDIGRVSMVGRLVRIKMRKANVAPEDVQKRVFRIATKSDLEKYEEAISREQDTMIRSRRIAEELGLNMKIGDVEYQGDGSKAIFYYIADERVDFRKLIRILADTFKVRIEMKQIGARQEAGRIGGIGPCGRPLCCSSWMTNFVSVGTGTARIQDLSMNPQKLAGQCAKLKCCINFEIDSYSEAHKKLPPKEVTLETKDATYFYFKPDILARKITYSTDKNIPANLITITAKRAFEIIALNKQGIKVDSLDPSQDQENENKVLDLVEQESLTRFDNSKKKKKKRSDSRTKDERGNDRNREERSNEPKQGREERGSEPRQGREDRSGNEPKHSESRKSGNTASQAERPRSERPQQQKPKGNNRPHPEKQQQRRPEKQQRRQRPQGQGQQGPRPQNQAPQHNTENNQ